MYDYVALLSTKREMHHLDVLKLGGTSGELGKESTKTLKVLAYVPGAASTNPNSLSRRRDTVPSIDTGNICSIEIMCSHNSGGARMPGVDVFTTLTVECVRYRVGPKSSVGFI